MNRQNLFRKWKRRLDVIENEIITLAVHRHVFEEVRGMVRANAALHKPSVFYNWMNDVYMRDAVIGLMRQVDQDSRAISLINLINDIRRHPEIMSRRRYVALYRKPNVWAFANRDFDRFSGVGKPHVSRATLRSDVLQLKRLSAVIKKYRDKKVAHLDKKGIRKLPTVSDLNKYQDLLEKLLIKYVALFRASVLSKVLPTFQYDWKEIFKTPWLK